jgi:hypothetical protein
MNNNLKDKSLTQGSKAAKSGADFEKQTEQLFDFPTFDHNQFRWLSTIGRLPDNFAIRQFPYNNYQKRIASLFPKINILPPRKRGKRGKPTSIDYRLSLKLATGQRKYINLEDKFQEKDGSVEDKVILSILNLMYAEPTDDGIVLLGGIKLMEQIDFYQVHTEIVYQSNIWLKEYGLEANKVQIMTLDNLSLYLDGLKVTPPQLELACCA